MSIEITPDLMLVRSDITGQTIACATRTASGWSISTQTNSATYNQAITALTIAESLDLGYGEDDPFVRALREELASG